MFKSLSLLLKYEFYEKYNAAIYLLLKMPLVNKLISKKIYKILWTEDLIDILGFFVRTISSIFSWIYLLLVGFYFIFNNFYDINSNLKIGWISNLDKYDYYLFFLAFILLIITLINIPSFYLFTRKDYIIVKRMRMKPRDYYLANFLYKHFFGLIGLVVAIFIILYSISTETKITYAINFALFIKGVNLIFSSIYLNLNIKNKKSIEKMNTIFLIMFIVSLIFLIIYPYISGSIIYMNIITNYISGVIGFILIVLSFLNVYYSKNIEKVYRFLNLDAINIYENIQKEEEKKINNLEKNENDCSNFSGLTYINKILFYRLNNKEKKVKIKRNIIKISIFLVTAIVINFVPFIKNMIVEILNEFNGLEDYKFTDIIKLLSSIIFIFIISQSFIKKSFILLDSKIIRNKVYKSFDNIKISFKLRYFEMIKRNLLTFIPVTLLNLNILYLINSKSIDYFELIALSIIGFLFAIYLIISTYFVFQPYLTEDLSKQNGVLKIFKMILYFSIVLIIVYRLNIYYIILIYFVIIILLLLLLKYLSPKNFKLR